jgi:hypothetical protein
MRRTVLTQGRWQMRTWTGRERIRRRILLSRRIVGALPVLGLVLLILSPDGAVAAGPIDLSGQYTLATVVIPVSATLIGGTWIGAPAEFIYPRLGIESTLDLTLHAFNTQCHVNSAMNFAGFERFIVDAKIPLGPMLIEPEIWCAVPFETVIDDDFIANSLAIPPGDMLFVKTRWTLQFEYNGLRFHDLFMIEDVKFPDPSVDFSGLEYGTQTQSFHVGNILTITAEPFPGVLLTSVTNICADPGANTVKGWSASGSVSFDATMCDDTRWFSETLSLSGLQYCGIPFWLSLAADPFGSPILTLTGGGSFSGFGDLELSGGFSLFPLTFAGFSFSGTWCDATELRINLSDAFEFVSASFSSTWSFRFGDFSATVSGSGSYTSAMGLSGVTFSATVRQGAFSGGMTIGVVNQLGNIVVASVSPRLQFTTPPVSLSVSLMFSRTRLTRAMLTVGVIF